MRDPDLAPRRVWDLPTRLTHWALVLLFAFSWWSGENGELAWHRRSGYAVLTLLLFRLAWGFAGSSTARFARFVRGPRAVLAYARRVFERRAAHDPVGHNPLGGWSVLAMLALLLLQTGSGLFAVDTDGLESGPLAHRLSFSAGRTLAGLHGASFEVLLALVGLHIAAVLFYLVCRRENLIAAMLSGRRRLRPDSVAGLRFAGFGRALALLSAAVALVAALLILG
ncbi:cytochrome b/b6 domain-containing protein [Solimonas soli]|uniref:cytochrome b/b6 domain-containing protein n=1 Tax=Solimonas soli TaxID=413479 RepID=UPI000487065B|nr:cytochrome b/b6 domain-containing protein [Solimonas soli]